MKLDFQAALVYYCFYSKASKHPVKPTYGELLCSLYWDFFNLFVVPLNAADVCCYLFLCLIVEMTLDICLC